MGITVNYYSQMATHSIPSTLTSTTLTTFLDFLDDYVNKVSTQS